MHWSTDNTPGPIGVSHNRHNTRTLQFWLMQTRFGCFEIIKKCSVGFRILGQISVKSVQMYFLLHPHGTQNTVNSTAMRVIPYI